MDPFFLFLLCLVTFLVGLAIGYATVAVPRARRQRKFQRLVEIERRAAR